MAAAAIRKAEEIKVLETVCVADDGGGIQLSFEGRFAVFVGGIGLSGGNGEQDIACGLAALQDRLGAEHRVLVQADIKL